MGRELFGNPDAEHEEFFNQRIPHALQWSVEQRKIPAKPE